MRSIKQSLCTQKIWLLIALIISSLDVFSQGMVNGQVASPIPPSPNARAFNKFVEVPVNLHSGLPQINVPVYTVKTSGLTVPISLSYHASGVKVDEISSWVGAGWSLQFGGVINREVRGGFPDEYDQFGFYAKDNTNTTTNAHKLKNFDPPLNEATDGTWLIPLQKKIFMDNIIAGLYDTEPDIFNFSFPSGSGKFIIGRDSLGNNTFVEVIPEQRIKVDVSNYPDSFVITDQQGTTYLFDNVEVTRKRGSDILPFYQYNSSWYLTEITALNNPADKITYQYDTAELHYDHTYAQSQTLYHMSLENFQPAQVSRDSIQYSARRIKSIVSSRDSVTFHINTANERQDMPGDYPLDSIKIYDNKGKWIKTMTYQYGYFGASITKNFRLKLLGVNEKTSAGALPGYKFYYNLMDPPSYKSADQDYWGYYNGKSNAALIPGLDIYHFRVGVGGQIVNGQFVSNYIDQGQYGNPILKYRSLGGDRSVDTDYAQAGVLTKIQYPTGGYTEYEYENNEIDINSGKKGRMKQYDESLGAQVDLIGNPSLTVPLNERLWGVPYDYYEQFFEGKITRDSSFSLLAVSGDNSPNQYHERTIYINHAQYVKVGGEINGRLGPPVLQDEIKKIGIEGVNGTVYFDEVKQNGFPEEVDGSVNVSLSGYLEAGWYRFYVQANTSDEFDKMVTMRVKWVHVEGDIINETIGGLRVKMTKSYTNINTIPLVKRYEYKNFKDPVRSSGMLMNEAKFAYQMYRESQVPAGQEDPFASHSSDNLPHLTITAHPNSGGPGPYNSVYYTNVTVYHGENGELGKTEYEYLDPYYETEIEHEMDGEGYIHSELFPFPYDTDYLWIKGQLSKKREYIAENGGFVLVKQDSNTYKNHYVSEVVEGYKYGYIGPHALSQLPDTKWIKYTSKFTNGYMHPETTVIDLFDPGTNTALRTSSTFEFGNPAHLQMTKQITTSSDGKVIETRYKYPLDYTTPGESMTQMQAKNLINIPVEQTQWVDGKLMSGSATAYQYNAVKDQLAPKSQHMIEITTGITDYTESADGETFDPRYHQVAGYKYDDHSNIIEITGRDEVTTAYVWGYDWQYPVAQIVGASFETVKAALGGDSGMNTIQTKDEQDLRDALAVLRSDPTLTGAMVTTYTYDPLIGLTTQTDPNGTITFYEYDKFNRLKLVRDFENKIIKKYEYHYTGQESNEQ